MSPDVTSPTIDLPSLLSALTGHHWLLLIGFLTLYVRKLFSPASNFPVEVPSQWLPVVSLGGGAVFGFVQALQTGQAWGPALLTTAMTAGAAGLFDALVTGFFAHTQAPKWVQAILFIADDLTGRTPGTPVSASVVVPPNANVAIREVPASPGTAGSVSVAVLPAASSAKPASAPPPPEKPAA